MFRHLLKLTWKRKSRNLMLSLEILLAFAIVFAIAAMGLRNWQLYRMPLGFDARDVWTVELQLGDNGKGSIDAAVYDALARGVRELPQVRALAWTSIPPYTMSTMSFTMTAAGGAQVNSHVIEAGDTLAATLGLNLVEGRWFSALDDGAATLPVVINRRMAQALFPGQAVLGRQFTSDTTQERPYKVVGVVVDYRDKGELMAPVPFTFMRLAPLEASKSVRTLVLKLAPGTGRAFEKTLNQRLKAIRNDWSYQIAPLSAQRGTALRTRLAPLVVLGTIAAFMLAMVAFGLFGVLWQNTTRRIPEIGVRRAVGARAVDIYRQIVAEQLLLSSFAMAIGLALLVQLPLTGALGEDLDWQVFVAAAGLSMVVIYLLSLLCSLYPGWRASRLDPAEALHYE